jgi:hypothetical protein
MPLFGFDNDRSLVRPLSLPGDQASHRLGIFGIGQDLFDHLEEG